MLARWKAFFNAHKKTGWIMKIFAGYLAGVVLCVGAGIVLIRPIADIPVFAFDPDNSSGFASEEESSSQQASELSSEEESSGGRRRWTIKKSRSKPKPKSSLREVRRRKKKTRCIPVIVQSQEAETIRAQSRLLLESLSQALPVLHPLLLIFRLLPPIHRQLLLTHRLIRIPPKKYLSPAVRQKEQSMVWMFHIIRETLIGTQSKIPVLNSCLFGWVTAVTAQGSSV